MELDFNSYFEDKKLQKINKLPDLYLKYPSRAIIDLKANDNLSPS